MENFFDLPSEYKELRASVRALSEKERNFLGYANQNKGW